MFSLDDKLFSSSPGLRFLRWYECVLSPVGTGSTLRRPEPNQTPWTKGVGVAVTLLRFKPTTVPPLGK